jgi:hypothetical protein
MIVIGPDSLLRIAKPCGSSHIQTAVFKNHSKQEKKSHYS